MTAKLFSSSQQGVCSPKCGAPGVGVLRPCSRGAYIQRREAAFFVVFAILHSFGILDGLLSAEAVLSPPLPARLFTAISSEEPSPAPPILSDPSGLLTAVPTHAVSNLPLRAVHSDTSKNDSTSAEPSTGVASSLELHGKMISSKQPTGQIFSFMDPTADNTHTTSEKPSGVPSIIPEKAAAHSFEPTSNPTRSGSTVLWKSTTLPKSTRPTLLRGKDTPVIHPSKGVVEVPSDLSATESRTIRINCGGPAFQDTKGGMWNEDHAYMGGKVYSSNNLSQNKDPLLFATERYGNFRYDIALPQNGSYDVVLHFAEIYFRDPGQRRFSVSVEERVLLDHFDLVSSVGFRTPYNVTDTFFVTDRILSVVLVGNTEEAKLSGIEVSFADTSPLSELSPSPSAGESITSLPSRDPFTFTNDDPTWSLPSEMESAAPARVKELAPASAIPSIEQPPVILQMETPLLVPSTTPTVTRSSAPFSSYISSTNPLIVSTTNPSRSHDSQLTEHPIFGSTESTTTTRPTLLRGKHTDDTSVNPSNNVEMVPSDVSWEDSSNIRINCGGPAFQDTKGVVWSEDRTYTGGKVYNNTKIHILQTADDLLYTTERYGDFRYDILLPQSGSYVVSLYFAEIYFRDPGQRSFSVSVEERVLLDHFDLVATVGFRTPFIITETVIVLDGILNILLFGNAKEAKLSGIEVSVAGPSRSTEPSHSPGQSSDLLLLNEPSASLSGTGNSVAIEGFELFQDDSNIPPRLDPYTEPSMSPTTSPIKLAASSLSPLGGFSPTIVPSSVKSAAPTSSDGGIIPTTSPSPLGAQTSSPLNEALHTLTFSSDTPTASPLSEVPRVHPSLTGSTVPIPSPVGEVSGVSLSSTYPTLNPFSFEVPIGSPSSLRSAAPTLNPVSDVPSMSPSTIGSAASTLDPRTTIQPTLNSSASPTSFADMAKKTTANVLAILKLPSVFPSTIPSKLNVSPEIFPTSTLPTESPPPSPSLPAENVDFQTIRINVGGGLYVDSEGRQWQADKYYAGHSFVRSVSGTIDFTPNDHLYLSSRQGSFVYNIPVPLGGYEVTLYFAETEMGNIGDRLFDVELEGSPAFVNFDIVKEAMALFRATSLSSHTDVLDGHLNVTLVSRKRDASLAGIEIQRTGPHLAHAVVGGPYFSVDTDGDNKDNVHVSGQLSHTHGPGASLVSFTWRVDGVVVAKEVEVDLTLAVGDNFVTLEVVDSEGSYSTESVVVVVHPKGYPKIEYLSPDRGPSIGGSTLTIHGWGFLHGTESITVQFSFFALSGHNIVVVNDNTIVVPSLPGVLFGAPIGVFVTTPLGKSNVVHYTSVHGSPILFDSRLLTKMSGATTVAFGPDENLYVGTIHGEVAKLTIDADYAVTNMVVSSIVARSNLDPTTQRVILGIAFDPNDRKQNPTIYVSHSHLFHQSSASFTGDSINGKVSIVDGANLEFMQDIISGLPISNHDHAINGMEFLDNGDLLIQVGGNTNAGVPGKLTAPAFQDENVLSAATLIAFTSKSDFNGMITYDDHGQVEPGVDVKVFASGQRNSYDICLHSNGNIYATDNGANMRYGASSLTCTERGQRVHESDKLNWIQPGKFYGHANRSRGECRWRSSFEPGDESYEAPLAHLPSSSDGLIEFKSNHFDGQMRGNLIVGQFDGPLHRVVLSQDGTEVVSGPTTLISTDGGLDVTQAPDGSLVSAMYAKGKIMVHRPIEAESMDTIIKSVFPNRGPTSGKLFVYGINFGRDPSLFLAGIACPILEASNTKIICNISGGTSSLSGDLILASGENVAVFEKAYRFI